jgi:hypothetical protein
LISSKDHLSLYSLTIPLTTVYFSTSSLGVPLVHVGKWNTFAKGSTLTIFLTISIDKLKSILNMPGFLSPKDAANASAQANDTQRTSAYPVVLLDAATDLTLGGHETFLFGRNIFLKSMLLISYQVNSHL